MKGPKWLADDDDDDYDDEADHVPSKKIQPTGWQTEQPFGLMLIIIYSESKLDSNQI